MENKKYKTVSVIDLPKSEREIVVEIEWEEMKKYREVALKKLSEKIELPGFRKGHVPHDIIQGHLGETNILEEAIDLWAKNTAPEIITEHGKEAIALPRITVTKAVPGNPVGLKMIIPLRPKLSLPDYKEIAKKENGIKEEFSISEKEIEGVIYQLRKHFAASQKQDKKEPVEDKDLPALDENFVKKFGEFKTVEDFHKKIKKNLTAEKTERARQKKRVLIVEKILSKTKGDIPQILVELELRKMEDEFKHEVEKVGLKFEDYLKNTKKTIDDIRKDWSGDAEKRARLQLVIQDIAGIEKIIPEKELVEKETSHLKEHYKNVDLDRLRFHVETFLTSEKVFDWLEKLS